MAKTKQDKRKIAKIFYQQEDFDKAHELFQQAADIGDTTAKIYLAYMYYHGQGHLKKDLLKALHLFEEAEASQEGQQFKTSVNLIDNDFHRDLLTDAADLYHYGKGVPKNLERAASFHIKKINWWCVDVNGLFNWAQVFHNYTDDEDADADDGHAVMAFYLYAAAAELNYVAAQNTLGYMYKNGQGIAKDLTKAFEWYQKAAEKDHASAQINLGWMYKNGQGIAEDLTKAFGWYQKAAEKDCASAQFTLGYMYKNGQGIAKDLPKALEWYQKAAENNHASAQFALGRMYENGQGIAKDIIKAFEWYQKAAEKDCASAQFTLGRMYERGAFVEQNRQKAFELYFEAARKNVAASKTNLARMCQAQ